MHYRIKIQWDQNLALSLLFKRLEDEFPEQNMIIFLDRSGTILVWVPTSHAKQWKRIV